MNNHYKNIHNPAQNLWIYKHSVEWRYNNGWYNGRRYKAAKKSILVYLVYNTRWSGYYNDIIKSFICHNSIQLNQTFICAEAGFTFARRAATETTPCRSHSHSLCLHFFFPPFTFPHFHPRSHLSKSHK